jgi:O-antigen/teichoic acid export membrane protein
MYGIWALLWLLASFEALSDFGITSALIVLISGNEQTEDKNRLITMGLVINTALTLLVVLILFAVKDLLLQSFFKVAGEERVITEQALIITLFTFLLLVVARTLAAVLDGLQRVDIRFALQSVVLLFWGFLTWILLAYGYGLLGIVVATFATGILRVVILAIATIWAYPALRFRFGIERARLSKMARFGLRLQFASIGEQLSVPLLKGFAAATGTAATVGTIHIGSSVASVPNSIVFSAIAILFPAISERHTQADSAGAITLAGRYLLYVVCFIFPISFFLIVAAPQLIDIWLGESHPTIVSSVRLLTLAFLFRSLGMVPWRVQMGLERPQDNSFAMLTHIGLFVSGGATVVFLMQRSVELLLIIFNASYAASSAYLFWRMHVSLPGFFAKDNRWLLNAIYRVVLISAALGLTMMALRTQIVGELEFLLASFSVLIVSFALILVVTLPAPERVEIKRRFVSLLPESFRSWDQHPEPQDSHPVSDRTELR